MVTDQVMGSLVAPEIDAVRVKVIFFRCTGCCGCISFGKLFHLWPVSSFRLFRCTFFLRSFKVDALQNQTVIGELWEKYKFRPGSSDQAPILAGGKAHLIALYKEDGTLLPPGPYVRQIVGVPPPAQ